MFAAVSLPLMQHHASERSAQDIDPSKCRKAARSDEHSRSHPQLRVIHCFPFCQLASAPRLALRQESSAGDSRCFRMGETSHDP